MRRMRRDRGVSTIEWVVIAMIIGVGMIAAFGEFKDRYLAPTTSYMGNCIESAAGDGELCGGGGNGAGGSVAAGSGANGGGAAVGGNGAAGTGMSAGELADSTGNGASGNGGNGGNGNGANGGVGANGGNGGIAANGGNGANGGIAANGGNGASGGIAANGGNGASGGIAANGGNGASGGAGEGGAAGGEPARHGGLGMVGDVSVDILGWGISIDLSNLKVTLNPQAYVRTSFGIASVGVSTVVGPGEQSAEAGLGVVYGALGHSADNGYYGEGGLGGRMEVGSTEIEAGAGVRVGGTDGSAFAALTNGAHFGPVGYDLSIGLSYQTDFFARVGRAAAAIGSWMMPPSPPGDLSPANQAMWTWMMAAP